MANKRGASKAASKIKKSHLSFAARKAQFAAQGKADPGGLAYYVGVKKYGKAGMAAKAAAGRAKAAAKRRGR